MGTDKQTRIIQGYPSSTPEQKRLIPYIEKMNGNISINCMKSEEDRLGSYRVAIEFYNKALFALKMIFDNKCDI